MYPCIVDVVGKNGKKNKRSNISIINVTEPVLLRATEFVSLYAPHHRIVQLYLPIHWSHCPSIVIQPVLLRTIGFQMQLRPYHYTLLPICILCIYIISWSVSFSFTSWKRNYKKKKRQNVTPLPTPLPISPPSLSSYYKATTMFNVLLY